MRNPINFALLTGALLFTGIAGVNATQTRHELDNAVNQAAQVQQRLYNLREQYNVSEEALDAELEDIQWQLWEVQKELDRQRGYCPPETMGTPETGCFAN